MDYQNENPFGKIVKESEIINKQIIVIKKRLDDLFENYDSSYTEEIYVRLINIEEDIKGIEEKYKI